MTRTKDEHAPATPTAGDTSGAPSGGPASPVLPARRLNPEAGDHRVTGDPAALAAVERAGARCYARLPSLDARYGARGRAFTTSDGAWLALLGLDAPEQARTQLTWLCGLLAARGMPSLVVEDYLEALAPELAGAGPGWTAAAAQLADAAAWLGGQRTAAFPARDQAALESRLAAAGPGPTPDAVTLLAAALADERRGLALAVPRLTEWLLDPARCAPAWRAAAEAAIALARAGAPLTPPR